MQENLSEEDSLLFAAKEGDKQAFEEIVIRYRPAAVRFAKSIIGDAFYAEDIAQESFAKIYLRLHDFKIGTSFKSWLFTIVRNLSIDYLRRQKNELALEYAEHICMKELPEEMFEKKEERKQMNLIWRTLSKEARFTLYLFAAEDMKYSEIAQTMGKTSAQVKMTIYRARKKLRREAEGI